GPQAILQASPQLDLHLRDLPKHYLKGFHLAQTGAEIARLNGQCKPIAVAIQQRLEICGNLDSPEFLAALDEVNAASRRVNELIYENCAALDRAGQYLAVIGGDHSSPYGLIRYLGEKYSGDFGVLHVDAHLDLRDSY